MALADIAAIAARYETAMARAMRRALAALGVDAPARPRDGHRYADMRWCFENHGSPMDGAR